jgi:Zn-dependent peptidase ImmA (M78 family)
LPERHSGQAALDAFAAALDADSPEQAMLRACRSLAQRVEAAGWTPDLPSYVKAFGIRVLEAPISQAGRLDFEPDGYVIRVKSARADAVSPTAIDVARARGRQRFSIAHELGHALLMERLAEQPAHLSGLHDPTIWPRIEQLCDQAAAELLVPMDDFVASLAREGIAPEAVERLAGSYAVSREVILRRFLDAGARSVAMWSVRTVAGSETLRGSVREAFAAADGPYLAIGVDSRSLSPNLVVRAARAGHAWSARLTLQRGVAHWSLAGVAQTARLLAPRGQARETEVLLVLLPIDAPERDDPLWHATRARPTHA